MCPMPQMTHPGSHVAPIADCPAVVGVPALVIKDTRNVICMPEQTSECSRNGVLAARIPQGLLHF